MSDKSIETSLGTRYFFNEPEFDIEDIAYGLSNLCRYTGRCSRFYSVAEHSLLVSHLSTNPWEGLLHDATEAYLGDISSPLKALLPDYRKLEHKTYKKLAQHFGIPEETSPETKKADCEALILEVDELMPSHGINWELYPKYCYILDVVDKFPFNIIIGMPPEKACELFLDRYHELKNGREVQIPYSSACQT